MQRIPRINSKSILIILLFASYCSGQSGRSREEEKINSLEKGNWSMIFEVGTFIDTQTFESFLLSGKYHLTAKTSMRLGVGFNSTNSDATSNITSGGLERSYPINSKKTVLRAIGSFVFYPVSKSAVTMFIGAGPVYRFDKNEYNSVDFYYNGQYMSESKHHVESEKWTAGINAIVGAEWFIFRQVSLIGEYNISAVGGKTTTDQTDTRYDNYLGTTITSQNKSKGNVSEFNVNIVRIGIAVYF